MMAGRMGNVHQIGKVGNCELLFVELVNLIVETQTFYAFKWLKGKLDNSSVFFFFLFPSLLMCKKEIVVLDNVGQL